MIEDVAKCNERHEDDYKAFELYKESNLGRKFRLLGAAFTMFGNKLTEANISPISDALKVNTTLEKLYLLRNNLNTTDAEDILSALKDNPNSVLNEILFDPICRGNIIPSTDTIEVYLELEQLFNSREEITTRNTENLKL